MKIDWYRSKPLLRQRQFVFVEAFSFFSFLFLKLVCFFFLLKCFVLIYIL